MSIEQNRKTVETMWAALSAMDWETMTACLAEDVFYEDVPTEDEGAHGRENVVKRLRIAFDHLADHQHTIHHLVCESDVAFLDHTEVWTFKTGEKATNTFATMHELQDGKISKWSDYWDVTTFVNQFPASFLEVMAKASETDFN